MFTIRGGQLLQVTRDGPGMPLRAVLTACLWEVSRRELFKKLGTLSSVHVTYGSLYIH